MEKQLNQVIVFFFPK